jgi:hypothetical protein
MNKDNLLTAICVCFAIIAFVICVFRVAGCQEHQDEYRHIPNATS